MADVKIKNKANGVISFVDSKVWEQKKKDWGHLFIVLSDPKQAPKRADFPELKESIKEVEKPAKK